MILCFIRKIKSVIFASELEINSENIEKKLTVNDKIKITDINGIINMFEINPAIFNSFMWNRIIGKTITWADRDRDKGDEIKSGKNDSIFL